MKEWFKLTCSQNKELKSISSKLENGLIEIVSENIPTSTKQIIETLIKSDMRLAEVELYLIEIKEQNRSIIEDKYLRVFCYLLTDLSLQFLTFFFDINWTKDTLVPKNSVAIINICENCSRNLAVVYPTTRNQRNGYLGTRYINWTIDIICEECSLKRKKFNEEVDQLRMERKRREEEEEEQKLQQIQLLNSIPYKEYLQTDHWKETRKRALKRAKYKCELCTSANKLNVHHKTYANKGNEKDEDLIVLCNECHSKFHDKFEPSIEEDKIYESNKSSKIKTKFFIVRSVHNDNPLDNQINSFLDNTYYKEIIDIKVVSGNNDTYSALMLYKV